TVIIIILAILVVIGGIVILRSSLSDKTEDSSEASTEATEEEENTEEATEEKTEEAAESAEEKTVPHSDWFADQGLSLSDTADSFTFRTMKNDGENDTDEMKVSSRITITETTENVEDGYKAVTAVLVHDISDSDGERGIIADGVFDRYTGTFYGFENEQPEQDEDSKSDKEDFIRITDGDTHYDIAIKTEQEVNAPMITKKIHVVCPSDYDGAVFFVGYDSLELDARFKELDPAKRLYTFDELPFKDAKPEEDDSDSDDAEEQSIYYFQYAKPELNGRSSWGTYEAEAAPVSTAGSDDSGSSGNSDSGRPPQ
ncbi:MAG: hypothetical protein J5966_08845, partial [Lachnospiraceae bacterium]|nr:hypothetical protein [Lachnospiraceae bacterium]